MTKNETHAATQDRAAQPKLNIFSVKRQVCPFLVSEADKCEHIKDLKVNPVEFSGRFDQVRGSAVPFLLLRTMDWILLS